MSYKHLPKYVNELARRENNTKDQMRALAKGMSSKWLRYEKLTG